MAALTNFAVLAEHDPQLVRFGMLAESYFPEDPNTCLIKLRQLTELLPLLALQLRAERFPRRMHLGLSSPGY